MTSGRQATGLLLAISQGPVADAAACHGLKSKVSTGSLTVKWTANEKQTTRITDISGTECGFAYFGSPSEAVAIQTKDRIAASNPEIHRDLLRQGARLVVIWGNGQVSIRGSASGYDRIYYSKIAKGVIVCDRADGVAQHIDAPIDPTGVAVHLMEPVGHPFDLCPLWAGVQPVQPGLMLCVEADLVPNVLPWWSSPEPRTSLKEGAESVRSAIEESIRDAGFGHDVVLTDLSGGLDSTSITALSLDLFPQSQIVAATAGDRGQNEDQVWAKRAARELELDQHLLLDSEDLPLVYSGILAQRAATDHPSPALATRATIQALASIGQGYGATTHLTGHGGDHMFYGMPTLLRDGLRNRPGKTIRKINAYRHMLGWPAREVLKQLASRQTFAAWLRDSTIPSNVPVDRLPILTWSSPPSLPPWLSTLGRELIDDYIADTVGKVSPLAPRPGAHAELDTIRQGAQLARAISQVSLHHGLGIQAPFFDDRVLAAVLSVSIEERVDPWTYKPLLKRAMSDVLPPAIYNRNSKDEGSLDLELGMRGNRADIQTLFQGSYLANLGLIDADSLTRLLETGSHPSLSDSGITTTLCTEVWLRAQENGEGVMK